MWRWPEGATAVVSDDAQPLGVVVFPNACAPDAQEALTRGLALLHHMTYLQAEAAFRAALEADPDCAIAYWGVAMTFVHPLWPDVVPADRLEAGRELLDTASGAAHSSDREAGYIEALRAYYGATGEETAESDRLLAFQSAWKSVHEAHPEDSEA